MAVPLGAAPNLALAALQGGNSLWSGPIVGMWRTVFTGTSGFVGPYDEGLQQFHSDFTELMISRGVPPDLGNVCMGVWKRLADGRIRLRHQTWNWAGQSEIDPMDPFGSAFSNLNTGFFELIVTLRVSSPGTRFSGTFEAASYDLNDMLIPGSQVEGTVESRRIPVD